MKLTSPGVPDIYQGQELWDFSLVDPDNRRPVAFHRRHRLVKDLEAEFAGGNPKLEELAARLCREPRDDLLKLYVSWRTIQFRRAQRDLFHGGEYIPLEVTGEKAAHVVAFAWRLAQGDQPPVTAIVVAPRLIEGLLNGSDADGDPRSPSPVGAEVWQDTQIELGDLQLEGLTNLFTGAQHTSPGAALRVSDVLSIFPVALLTAGA